MRRDAVVVVAVVSSSCKVVSFRVAGCRILMIGVMARPSDTAGGLLLLLLLLRGKLGVGEVSLATGPGVTTLGGGGDNGGCCCF